MKIIPDRHEDERRVLWEWNKDIPMKRCKALVTKGNVTLGKHYHKKNDSIFFILQGKGICILQDLKGRIIRREWMFEGDCKFVPRDVVHTFKLLPNTILLEASSEPYDKEDEIPFIE